MSNASVNGTVPRDQSYSNFTVDNTSVVRGKQSVQELDVVTLTGLDTATLKDVVVTGSQEIDGNLTVSGTATFETGVVIPVYQTELTLNDAAVNVSPTPPAVSVAYTLRQNNVVNLTFAFVSVTGSTVTAGTTLFTLPESDWPLMDIYFDTFTTAGGAGSIFKIESTTGVVTSITDITTASTRTASISFVVLQ